MPGVRTTVRDFPVEVLGDRARAWLSGELGPPAPPRSSATVMLVRDGDAGDAGDAGAAGVEVFVLRRVPSMAFAPRMSVFPGGGVDPRDADLTLPWAGPSPAHWGEVLGAQEAVARGLVVAAVREVFEECGVLLAGPSPTTVVADVSGPEWEAQRGALVSGGLSLGQLLQRRGLVLRSDLLSPRGHWVTPEFEPRRYDTRFFAALLPVGQVADDHTTEADHAGWADPVALLADYAAGAALMLPPTVVCVEQAAAAGSAASFVAQQVPVVPVMPWPVLTAAGPVIRCELPV